VKAGQAPAGEAFEPGAASEPDAATELAAPGTSAAPDGPAAIEDYALIGDCRTAALVSIGGSIDWLCWPRFDSNACFATLLGDSDNGRWLIAPCGWSGRARRLYRDGSVVLETVFATDAGEVALIDFMPTGHKRSSIVRMVEGRRGTVAMEMALALRFDYGSAVPWVRRLDDEEGVAAIAGPEQVVLRSTVPTKGRGLTTVAEFSVAEGECVSFTLTHGPSHLPPSRHFDPAAALCETMAFWERWIGRCTYDGAYRDVVRRSLITLKALTFHATGAIVAAPTTSLPEQLGGTRNWDYRFCWLRDATLTLMAFMYSGYYDEAQAWRDWLERSVAGSPEQTQIMYGIGGERRLQEWEAHWLPGYQGAQPVRIGNAASEQLQLDVFGEVLNALHQSRVGGLEESDHCWAMEIGLIEHVSVIWEQPDEGIWETRGGRQHFTFSKIMAWVAVDRGIRSAEQFGREAPLEKWRALRQRMHDTICARGFNTERNSFAAVFGGKALDASLLLAPMFGFLPYDDPRITGTVAAIEHDLLRDGFVLRYDTGEQRDGLPPGEGAFLACSYWLVTAYARMGRLADARGLFERLIGLINDVGLLSEEYDPQTKRQTGNFPQALSHISLIGAALSLQGEAAAEAPKD
jgi:GH15 family glucan-1,4-alpha-glucosidase